MDDLLQIGIITAPRGLKGEMKVFPTTDDKDRFLDLESVLVSTPEGIREMNIESCRFFKQFVLLKLEGIDGVDQAERYRRCPLLVDRENAVDLEEDEYFIADLIGLTIVDDSGVTIGKLLSVIETGANDVYEVRTDDGGTILLPAIKDCILDVDTEEGIILVHMMKGLAD